MLIIVINDDVSYSIIIGIEIYLTIIRTHRLIVHQLEIINIIRIFIDSTIPRKKSY